MRSLLQRCLNLGARRQMRPVSLTESARNISQPPKCPEPPREHMDPELVVRGFLFVSAGRGIVGARDLRELKILFDNYALAENTYSLGQWELARALARCGIAYGQREMQPYEAGYERAILETGSLRPQVPFFVMPPAYPIRSRDQSPADPAAETPSSEQAELFPEGPSAIPGENTVGGGKQ